MAELVGDGDVAGARVYDDGGGTLDPLLQSQDPDIQRRNSIQRLSFGNY
jgi:hypothetical protein